MSRSKTSPVAVTNESVRGINARTIYLKMSRCSFALLPTVVYEDGNYVQIPFNTFLCGSSHIQYTKYVQIPFSTFLCASS